MRLREKMYEQICTTTLCLGLPLPASYLQSMTMQPCAIRSLCACVLVSVRVVFAHLLLELVDVCVCYIGLQG